MGPAPLVGSIHVEIGHRLGQWVDRLRHIMRRAQEPLLFGRHREKEHGPFRRLGGGAECLGQFEESSRADGVVGGPVKDLVALEARVAA